MKIKYFKLVIFSFALCFIYYNLPIKPVSAAIIRKPPNNLGLVGYWKFDEGTGGFAGDSSGNGNHGTLSGFALSGVTSNWVNGKHGKALDFDGSDHITVTVPAGSVLDFTTASRPTIAFWLKVASISSDVRLIEEVRDGGWGIEYTTGGLLRLITYGVNIVGWSGVVTADNTWHYYVVTFDGVNATLYKDGALVSAQAYSPGWSSSASTLYLGGEGSFHLNGRMDDVRVYSRALTAAQVSSLYQSGQVTRKIVSNQGLVGYWAMNEGRGNVVGDSSGNGNHGSATSTQMATWVGGKRGGALDFDGSNDYVLINNTLGNFGTSDFTAAAWIKPSVIENNTILGKRSVCDHDSFWNMTVTAAGKIAAEVDQNAGGTGYINVGGVTSLATSTWYHATMVRSANTLKVYLNGVEEGSGSTTTTASISNSSHLLIGGTPCPSRNFQGLIDDVRIYSRALSANEVDALYRQNETKMYASQNDKFTNGLIGLWSFNGADYEVASTTAEVLDRSGQGNNGNAINGAMPAPGKVGQALSFDGVDDYVAISDTFNPTAYTISAWVKKNSVTNAPIFLRTDSSGPASAFSHMLYTNNNKFVSYVWDGSSKETLGTTVFKAGEWYHVVGTAENSGFIRVYVNGVEEGTPVAVGTIWTGGDRYRIGQGASCVSCGYFDGVIDEVRLYNRVLSATEVKQLYNLGR